MIKIGEMSKICNVSVQTLRYYDKIGLLKADKVEESSGYRYYSPEKVKTFQRIEYLKKTGLTLDEIRLYFNAPITEQYRILEGKKQFHGRSVHDWGISPNRMHPCIISPAS